MVDKPFKPRPQKEKRRPADLLVRGIKEKEIGLDEEELKKISGGIQFIINKHIK